MKVSSAQRPSIRATFQSLIDYAGLFPPAQLSIRQAAREYEASGSGPYAWMLGRFIIPATQLIESAEGLRGPFSVIADGQFATLKALAAARESGLPIEALELSLPKSVTFDKVADAVEDLYEPITAKGFGDAPVFVELPRSGHWPEIVPRAMSALRSRKFGAKLRCGGVTANAFPTVDEVAEFIAYAVDSGVPFKATAGLHHPVRHVDKTTGFTMHGFLNILAAAGLAARVERDTLVRIVAEEDPAAFSFDDSSFAWRDQRMGLTELHELRRAVFVSYGSCSFSEPVEDLIALGLVPSQ